MDSREFVASLFSLAEALLTADFSGESILSGYSIEWKPKLETRLALFPGSALKFSRLQEEQFASSLCGPQGPIGRTSHL